MSFFEDLYEKQLVFFYVRNNWFEIWHFYPNLVFFGNNWNHVQQIGKILLVTHNQECKKIIIIEGYMHFLVGMKHAYLY